MNSTIKSFVHDLIAEGLGLPKSQVIWYYPNAPRPPKPYATLEVFAEVGEAQEDIQKTTGVGKYNVVVPVSQTLRVQLYGKNGTDLKLLGRDINGHGQEIDVVIFGRTYHLKLNVIGEFQAMNYLLAVGLAGMDDNNILDNLEEITQSLKAPRGRIDYVGTLKNGASVYVDYAHTPDALEKLLENLRPHTTAKLAVVFGCGGDRDASKRPLMGEIADRLADRVYVTDDNPLTENPADIRKAIMKTCQKGIEFDSRKTAIETAIKELSPYDILVIAGKGHEEGQTIGKIVYPFNDKTIAKEYITNEGL